MTRPSASNALDVNRWVAFLRAINVGGHAVVRMTDLRDAFAAAGCKGVRTYIQSGNVVFESPSDDTAGLFERIRARLRDLLGAEPEVLFRTAREVEKLVAGNPFGALMTKPDVKLYVAFLAQKPRKKPAFPLRSAPEALEVIAMKGREVFIVSRRKKNGLYGFPNGFIEKALGVPATSRNWNTVTKIVAFAAKAAEG